MKRIAMTIFTYATPFTHGAETAFPGSLYNGPLSNRQAAGMPGLDSRYYSNYM